MDGLTTRHEQHISCPRVIHDHHQRHLVKIVCSNRQMILTQIPSAFNAGVTRCIFNRSVQSSLISMEYSTSPWLVLLLTEPWGSSNMYHGLMMSQDYCCFRVIEFGSGAHFMMQKIPVLQAGGDSIMDWVPLFHLNISLTSDCYITLLDNNLCHFSWLFLQDNALYHQAQVHQISILETSSKWCSHYFCLTLAQWSIYVTCI